jgi:hypothetical protein
MDTHSTPSTPILTAAPHRLSPLFKGGGKIERYKKSLREKNYAPALISTWFF